MEFTINHDGTTVYGSVSPCSWMYPGYGLQVKLSLTAGDANAGSEFALDKSVPADTMTRESLPEAGEALARRWLAENGIAPLRAAQVRWAKAQAEFDAEMAKSDARQAKADARRIAKMKAKGYTHRVLAVIHPARGDDYRVEMLCAGAPTDGEIAKLLAKSEVKDQYTVTVL